MARTRKKKDDEILESVATTEENEIKMASQIGIVANCLRLNVRKDPSLQSEVICVIPALTEVEIVDEISFAEWYKVLIGDSNGYCLKKYIVKKEPE